MTRVGLSAVLAAAALFLFTANRPAAAAESKPLFAIEKNFDLSGFETKDAGVQLVESGERAFLRLTLGHKDHWPGLVRRPEPAWDLSPFGFVVAEVRNAGTTPARIGLRLDSPASSKKPVMIQTHLELAPGQAGKLRLNLSRKMPDDAAKKLFGMRGYPGGYQERKDVGVDASQITRFDLFVAEPKADSVVELLSIRAEGRPSLALPNDPEKWFPLIDRFGQYSHADWPGKIHSEADFAARRAGEDADLKKNPCPAEWDQYGGWKAGPKLDATGRFRVARHEGKWWLVDPEGRLFWSHGIDCIRMDNSTPITDRKHYFAELPDPKGPMGRFFGKAAWAPHGYYEGKKYETFNFIGLNLLRKYGDDWWNQSREHAHLRLRSWGMNTVANWSDPSLFADHKTPYTPTVHVSAPALEGSAGYWGKFHDVFDPRFREGLRRSMASHKTEAADPWCLGFFVDNELGWGDELSLAAAALASPAEQPAKRAFLDDLKAKYKTIEAVNAVWGTKHASWDALAQSREVPDRKKAHDDLAAFATRTAETYFRECRAAVKEASPDALYLGCRFAWANERAVRAAAKYCDIVSYNLYRDSIAEFRLPDGVDMPLIVGEFHFGALDRGMFHTGLRPVENQDARAKAYANYVRGALAHPNFVGTHWFQYGDQATTGRGDGENYQIGFVDTADTPYAETIAACREVGYAMYRLRAK